LERKKSDGGSANLSPSGWAGISPSLYLSVAPAQLLLLASMQAAWFHAVNSDDSVAEYPYILVSWR
jgi:hypothetical protein